MVILKEPF